MDKINEIKNKLEVRACNPNLRMERQVALDALNVITEQESEIARLRCDLASAENSAKCSRALKEKAESENLELLGIRRTLEFANEQLRLKLDGQRDRIVKLSAECDELKQKADIWEKDAARNHDCVNCCHVRYNDVYNENGKIKHENDKLTKELHELRERLHEAIAKASSFVVDPDEVEKVISDRCPVCKNDFRLFFKRGMRVNVTGESRRKYANCPKCDGVVNDSDNKMSCGRCGALLDWGSKDGK